MTRFVLLFLSLCAVCPAGCAGAQTGPGSRGEVAPAEPDAMLAARIFSSPGPLTLARVENSPPGWDVTGPAGPVGHIGSTWEIAGSVGYSGRPIDILVGVTPDARIAGAHLMRHEEPVLTLGISTDDIAAYVGGFAGLDLTREQVTAFGARSDLPDVIARATVSTGVIRDAILRTARTLALGRGLVGSAGGAVDRVAFAPAPWADLAAEGALASVTTPMAQARGALAGAKVPLPESGDFLDLWIALLDPPTIGRNLLGQQDYTRAIGTLRPGDAALFVASRGLHSHRGTDWRRSDVFDRIEVIQGAETFTPTTADFLRVDRLAAEGAPEFREMSVFRLPGDQFDPTLPFRVEVTATRPTEDGEATLTIPLDYQLPDRFLLPSALPETPPLWVSAWSAKRLEIAGVVLMLAVLTGILFFQEGFVKRPLWLRARYAFLSHANLGWGRRWPASWWCGPPSWMRSLDSGGTLPDRAHDFLSPGSSVALGRCSGDAARLRLACQSGATFQKLRTRKWHPYSCQRTAALGDKAHLFAHTPA